MVSGKTAQVIVLCKVGTFSLVASLNCDTLSPLLTLLRLLPRHWSLCSGNGAAYAENARQVKVTSPQSVSWFYPRVLFQYYEGIGDINLFATVFVDENCQWRIYAG